MPSLDQFFGLTEVVIAALAMGFLGLLTRSHPALGWIIIGSFIVAASDFQAIPNHVVDAAVLVLLVATFGSVWTAVSNAGRTVGLILLIVAVGSFSWLRGLSLFGFEQASSESRAYVHLVVATLWVLTQLSDDEFLVRFRLWIVCTSWATVAVAIWHVSTRGLGRADLNVLIDGQELTTRPLVSGQAVFLAAAAIYLWVEHQQKLLPVSCLVTVVASQHRSVWLASGAALLAVALIARSGKIRSTLILVGTLLGLFSIGVWLSGVAHTVFEDLAYSFTSRETLKARTEGWRYLIDRQLDRGPVAVLFGQPFGTGWLRPTENGASVAYSPHNWYVTTFLRLGVLGTGAVLLFLLQALWHQRRTGQTARVGLFALLAVYALAYNPPWYLAPVLAVCLWRTPLRTERESELTSPALRTRTGRRTSAGLDASGVSPPP